MKIALATGNYKNVVGHPGRCKGFIIYEIENGKIINKEERENTFRHGHDHNHAHEHSHNHDHHNDGYGGHGTLGKPIAEMLQDCDYFVAKSMGPGFVNQLQAFNIKPAVVDNVNDAETAALQLVEYLGKNQPE